MTDEDKTEDQPQEEAKLDKADLLKVIANALKIGTITSDQAASMRADLGVFGSDFTKSKESQVARKKKRKAQAAARKVTRGKGYKGQQPPSGRSKMGSGRGR